MLESTSSSHSQLVAEASRSKSNRIVANRPLEVDADLEPIENVDVDLIELRQQCVPCYQSTEQVTLTSGLVINHWLY